MGEWLRRLFSCERELDRYRRMISDLERQMTALEQQLAQARGNV